MALIFFELKYITLFWIVGLTQNVYSDLNAFFFAADCATVKDEKERLLATFY